MKPLLSLFLALFAVAAASPARAAIVTTTVKYEHDGVVLEGFLAHDDTISSLRPGVLVVHQWLGISDHERDIAVKLAEAGYVAFCADIYGKGDRPADSNEAGAYAGKYRADRALFRERLNAGLEQLKALPGVDPAKTAAIGYCFGGGGVLELARSGADTLGVVSFHGNLDTPNAADARAITAKVLVHHGANDPLVPDEQLLAFMTEMRAAEVDWTLVSHGGAVHSFTDKKADSAGVAMYDADADRRSWESTMAFFDELFR